MNFPKTAGQCKYVLALRSNKPIIIGTGPAGSGKTILACQIANEYISEFRAKNRIWPSLDMSSANRKLEKEDSAIFPYGSPKMIKRSLEIDSFDLNTIDIIASRTNVSFYCILKFEVLTGDETETISLSGQEMDGIADPGDFGKWMDFSLKTK